MTKPNWPPTARSMGVSKIEWIEVGERNWISRPAKNKNETLVAWWAHRSPVLDRNDLGTIVFDAAHHRLESLDPLTIAPSLLCLPADLCGLHGFVRDGKWVPA